MQTMPSNIRQLPSSDFVAVLAQSAASEDEAIEMALPKGLLWRMPALRRLAMPAPGWLPQLARGTQVANATKLQSAPF
jgi:hypothetical protein